MAYLQIVFSNISRTSIQSKLFQRNENVQIFSPWLNLKDNPLLAFLQLANTIFQLGKSQSSSFHIMKNIKDPPSSIQQSPVQALLLHNGGKACLKLHWIVYSFLNIFFYAFTLFKVKIFQVTIIYDNCHYIYLPAENSCHCFGSVPFIFPIWIIWL